MKKGKKRLVIGLAVLAVGVGGVAAFGKVGGSGPEAQLPQVPVMSAQRGDVEQVVDATGTVVSEEQKTFFSPVNAQISRMNFEQGDTVKAGTKLVEFNLENLEKDNRKADLSLKSGKYDYQDAVNKSDQADKKQSDAKTNVKSLEQRVQEQKNYVASLQSQLAAVNAQAQRDAQAAAQAEAARAAEAAQAQAAAEAAAEEAKNQELQRAYAAALATYNNETLPQYQQELGVLNAQAIQALNDYNAADNTYQMTFTLWQADPTDENNQAVSVAEQNRSQAEAVCQQAKEQYEIKKTQEPQMPAITDFMQEGFTGDFVTDGTETETPDMTDQGTVEPPSAADGGSSYTAPDTSGIQNALEQAGSDLAELQSELASEKAIAEADSAGMTKEQKEKMKISNNLSQLDAKTAEELVAEGRNGISAEFNGVISKSQIQEGASVSQGMELFTIQNIDKVSVDINISKYDYDKVAEGQTAEINMADHEYEGTVEKVSHVAVANEKGTPMISATVSIKNPDEKIFLGVDAAVKIHAATAKDVLTLPVEVVNIGKDGSFCYVIENGVIARRDITTGLSSNDYVEVTEGVSEDDQIISDMGAFEEGMQVQALLEAGTEAAEDNSGAAKADE